MTEITVAPDARPLPTTEQLPARASDVPTHVAPPTTVPLWRRLATVVSAAHRAGVPF